MEHRRTYFKNENDSPGWDFSNCGYLGYEFQFQKQLDEDVKKLESVTTIPVSSIIEYSDKLNFIRHDGHPTALANQRIAKRLAEPIK